MYDYKLGFALKLLLTALPWTLRRPLLQLFFGYSLHPKSRIGLAWVFPKHLILDEHAEIGHLTVCKGLTKLHIEAHGGIGRLNWITAEPLESRFFKGQPGRTPELVVGASAAITNRHLLDCSGGIRIGAATTFAGFRSQILTHSIDLETNLQTAAPVEIGKHCFIGTDSVLLKGSRLPDYCVLGAKSLLNKPYTETHWLYAGTPAKPVKRLGKDLMYFNYTRE